MFDRRRFLQTGISALCAQVTSAAASAGQSEEATPNRKDALAAARLRSDTLAAAAARTGILFGSCIDPYQIERDLIYSEAVARDCSQIVPGNSLKAYITRKSPEFFDFSAAEECMTFARRNGLSVRGHTLIWNVLPAWIERAVITAEQATAELLLQVKEPCRHFRGRLDSWDVVNEPINVWDGQPGSFANNIWFRLIGPDYVAMSLSAARESDPHATLVLNENGIEFDTPASESKRQALLALLRSLRREQVPIDALGIQSHLGQGSKFTFVPEVFRRFLHEIQSMNLKILITELDFTDSESPVDIKERDLKEARMIADYMDVVLAEPGVLTVNVWGLSDRYTWLSKFAPRADGLPVRPCVLDQDLARKPAYYALIRAFENCHDIPTAFTEG